MENTVPGSINCSAYNVWNNIRLESVYNIVTCPSALQLIEDSQIPDGDTLKNKFSRWAGEALYGGRDQYFGGYLARSFIDLYTT